MNSLMLTERPREALKRCWAVNASDSGSGPKTSNSGCTMSRPAIHNIAPKRRGSLKRINTLLANSISTWSCFATGVADDRTRRVPDMPRWLNIKPLSMPSDLWFIALLPRSQSHSKYLPRRMMLLTVVPCRRSVKFAGMGHRSRRSRTVTRSMRCPRTWGSKPRRVVSTSGSSGMLLDQNG